MSLDHSKALHLAGGDYHVTSQNRSFNIELKHADGVLPDHHSSKSVDLNASRGMTRSTSIRGLNLNTISPKITPNSSFHKRSISVLLPLPQVEKPYQPKNDHDVPLPPMDQLSRLDIDEQLRLLAFKEMSMVEIKDNITSLSQTLEVHEKEIHKLREVIQRSLYKELNSPHGNVLPLTLSPVLNRVSNPREEAIASTRRRTSSVTSPNSVPPKTTGNAHENRNSKLWSSISKPLNMLQQFDTMLQNEFERSLAGGANGGIVESPELAKDNQKNTHTRTISGNGQTIGTGLTLNGSTLNGNSLNGSSLNGNSLNGSSFNGNSLNGTLNGNSSSGNGNVSNGHLNGTSNGDSLNRNSLNGLDEPAKTARTQKYIPHNPTHKSKPSEDSISSYDSFSPLKAKSRRNDPMDAFGDRKDDIMQTVSSSIWSFVNDVTSNVLSSLSEEPGEKNIADMYNLDNGSSVSLKKMDKFPDKYDSMNNSDFEEILDTEDDDKIDLSMYSTVKTH